ncbi:MAG: hypothetical protein JW797_16230 [Bradymonadales bacterium]|nr:hypothetical protein [Bradymonadales bacterium]
MTAAITTLVGLLCLSLGEPGAPRDDRLTQSAGVTGPGDTQLAEPLPAGLAESEASTPAPAAEGSGSVPAVPGASDPPTVTDPGAMMILVHVAVDRLLSERIAGFGAALEELLAAEGHACVRTEAGNGFQLDLAPELGERLARHAEDLPLVMTETGPGRYRFELDPGDAAQSASWAIDSVMSTIRSRLAGIQLLATVVRYGEEDLLVTIPQAAAEQLEEITRLIESPANLEFRGVHPQDATYWIAASDLLPTNSRIVLRNRALESPSYDLLAAFLAVLRGLDPGSPGSLPPGATVAIEETEVFEPTTGQALERQTLYRPVLVDEVVEMTGEHIADVQVEVDDYIHRPYISVTFDAIGQETFCDVTRRYQGQMVAIMLDGAVLSAPVVQEPICEGRCRIALGGHTYESLYQQAEMLAILLRHGSYPAPAEVVWTHIPGAQP